MYQFLKIRTTYEAMPEVSSEHRSCSTNHLNINDYVRETKEGKFIHSVNSRLSTAQSSQNFALQSPEPTKSIEESLIQSSIVSLDHQDDFEEPPKMSRFPKPYMHHLCSARGDTWRNPDSIRESNDDMSDYKWLQTEDRLSTRKRLTDETSRKKISLQNGKSSSDKNIEPESVRDQTSERVKQKSSFGKKNMPLRIETIYDREQALKRNKTFMQFVEQKAGQNTIDHTNVSQTPSNIDDSLSKSNKNSFQTPHRPSNRRYILPF